MKSGSNEYKLKQTLLLLVGIPLGLILLNALFLSVMMSATKTTTLLKAQLGILSQQKQLIASQAQVYSLYKDDIDTLSKVFPNEETIADFISAFEAYLKKNSDEFSFKFSSLTPVAEQDKLFLPAIIMMKTDLPRLISFLQDVENLPYMTHIVSIQSKNDEGFTGKQVILIGIKLYVQNPFTAK